MPQPPPPLRQPPAHSPYPSPQPTPPTPPTNSNVILCLRMVSILPHPFLPLSPPPLPNHPPTLRWKSAMSPWTWKDMQKYGNVVPKARALYTATAGGGDGDNNNSCVEVQLLPPCILPLFMPSNNQNNSMHVKGTAVNSFRCTTLYTISKGA